MDQACIAALARALDRAPPSVALPGLAEYADLVRVWNRKVNLVSTVEPERLVEILFADALVLADTALVPHGARVLDVGAGAGAPTLPLLLLRPDLCATCVEPRRKRATFLRHAAARLGIGARSEVGEHKIDPDRPAHPDAPFAVALSRATFAPAIWLCVGTALAARVVVMTAREAPPAPPERVRVTAEVRYRLPSDGAPRRIAVYDASESRGGRAGRD